MSNTNELKIVTDGLLLVFLGVEVDKKSEEDKDGKMIVSFTVPTKSEITVDGLKECIEKSKFGKDASITTEELSKMGDEFATPIGLAKVAKKMLSFDIYNAIKAEYKNNFGKESKELTDTQIMEFIPKVARFFYAPRNEKWTLEKGAKALQDAVSKIEDASKYTEI